MTTPLGPETLARQRWMGILARASRAEIEDLFAALSPSPAYRMIKRAETGTVMLEARAGGTGRRFNLGETTVTRCVIQTEDGTMGFSYALGRDTVKAERAAVLDAVLQSSAEGSTTIRAAIDRLQADHTEKITDISRKAAATKVNFFTLVRGED